MRLSDKAIQKFKVKYFNDNGIRLSDDEANSKGLELLEFMRFVMQPIPKKDYEYLKKNC